MRDHFGVDWAFGIRGGIESVVRSQFPSMLRLWPLLQAFNFDAYSIGDRWLVIVLKDKLNGIPAGNSKLLPFPRSDHPPLPPTSENVAGWQSYLTAAFQLRNEDAAMILPIHDSGRHGADADYDLFTDEEKLLWDLQLRLIVARQKAGIDGGAPPGPSTPTHITYYVTGSNARVNINSRDSSVNVVNDPSAEVFEQLLKAIGASAADAAEKAKLEASVREMRDAYGSPGFVDAYVRFTAIMADHIQILGPLVPIVAPYLPALARLLS
jgi:hypothetical protein